MAPLQKALQTNGIKKTYIMSLVNFILLIAEALISTGQIIENDIPTRPGRPKKRSIEETSQVQKVGRKPAVPQPCTDIRFDREDHWPQPRGYIMSRCRHCTGGYSKIYCSKCNVCLCLRSCKNCFAEYHTKKKQ